MISYLASVLNRDGLGRMSDADLDACALLFAYYLSKEAL